jgi:regulator of sigma E protease
MLDEREAPVPPHERHLAFNTQPLAAAQPSWRPAR